MYSSNVFTQVMISTTFQFSGFQNFFVCPLT